MEGLSFELVNVLSMGNFRKTHTAMMYNAIVKEGIG